jgi:hypothetical protein
MVSRVLMGALDVWDGWPVDRCTWPGLGAKRRWPWDTRYHAPADLAKLSLHAESSIDFDGLFSSQGTFNKSNV